MDIIRRSLALMLAAGVLLSCSGCAVAGGAVVGHVLATHSRMGVGQDVNGSVSQSVAVVKDVLKGMQLPVTSERERLFGVEISTKYQSHRVWIEVRDRSAETSRIDVRLKWPTGDKEDARRILGVIMAAFDKAWRTIRDHYYDPSFNGVGWNAVRDRYRPRAEAAQSDHGDRRAGQVLSPVRCQRTRSGRSLTARSPT